MFGELMDQIREEILQNPFPHTDRAPKNRTCHAQEEKEDAEPKSRGDGDAGRRYGPA